MDKDMQLKSSEIGTMDNDGLFQFRLRLQEAVEIPKAP